MPAKGQISQILTQDTPTCVYYFYSDVLPVLALAEHSQHLQHYLPVPCASASNKVRKTMVIHSFK